MLLRLAVPLLTAAVSVPSVGHLWAEPTIVPVHGHLVPTRIEPTAPLDVPPNCRLLPADQQPDRHPEGLAAAYPSRRAGGTVITLYVPATTCNTPLTAPALAWRAPAS